MHGCDSGAAAESSNRGATATSIMHVREAHPATAGRGYESLSPVLYTGRRQTDDRASWASQQVWLGGLLGWPAGPLDEQNVAAGGTARHSSEAHCGAGRSQRFVDVGIAASSGRWTDRGVFMSGGGAVLDVTGRSCRQPPPDGPSAGHTRMPTSPGAHARGVERMVGHCHERSR